MKIPLFLLLLLSFLASGCEFEVEYDYETVSPTDCSSCPPFTSLFYSHYANASNFETYYKVSDCVYNYTCLTVQQKENYVIVNATDDIKVATGYFMRVHLTDKPYPEYGDPINVFDALGFQCIDSKWYATKFPYGLWHNGATRNMSAADLVGIKLPIQAMSILCN
ncbi:hypothetical protein CRE_27935 [Caenorhabditis remanei]|uniref:Lipoprotein n=1 Tax=Caenorhabditis remanei TaxID=31234 RepID=E3NIZ1_CAERE|nr:hypothetical protein CRE_22139 [Caenorhabditis remanei]EFP10686.1 hypothetical protein CRE_27935 [Caenorhabditis remanei]